MAKILTAFFFGTTACLLWLQVSPLAGVFAVIAYAALVVRWAAGFVAGEES